MKGRWKIIVKVKSDVNKSDKAKGSNFNILYLTSLDLQTFRRPKLAKMALPQIKPINYTKTWRTSMKNVIISSIYYRLKKFERVFSKNQRWGGDYLLSAYYYDFVNYLLLVKNLNPHTVITLNTPLALGTKMLNRDIAVIVDWMDVWMWPWDEMNSVDVKTIERADAVIFWSRPFMEVMTKRLGIRRAAYIPCGIDLRIFDPLRQGDAEGVKRRFNLENKFVILYSGGLWRIGGMELQGVDKVIEAFALFSRKVKDTLLALQIHNYDVKFLKDIEKLGISDKVVLIGKLPSFSDPTRQGIFSVADILILPASRHPTIYYAERMKAFQYMAAAKPVIAEKTPGAESALGDTAIYVRLGDVEEISDAMFNLYNDHELRAKLGERARQKVESQYDWSVLIPKYRDFILQIIN